MGRHSIQVQQYIYVGLPMTTYMDMNANVQDKERNAIYAHQGIRQFLSCIYIQTDIGTHLVRSVLVLIATYECELY